MKKILTLNLIIILELIFLSSCATERKTEIIERDIPVLVEDIDLPVSVEFKGGESGGGYYRTCVGVELKSAGILQYSTTQGRKWEEYTMPFRLCSTTPLMVRLKDRPERYRIFSVKIDTDPPEITATIQPLPNESRWNNSDVTIIFQCRDNLSGVETCPSSQTIMEEGSGQVVRVKATDRAGNVSEYTHVINIDKTPPEVSIGGIVDGRRYHICENPTGSYIYRDALSGIKRSNFYIEGGNENGTGVFYYTVTVEDNAGNITTESLSYYVIYSFNGFVSPQPFEGPYKKGTVIPVGFLLTDGCRNNVYNAKAQLRLEKVSDDVIDGEPVETDILFGDSGDVFRYDYINNLYRYDLSTEDLSNGKWRITVILDDGMSYSGEFFVK